MALLAGKDVLCTQLKLKYKRD